MGSVVVGRKALAAGFGAGEMAAAPQPHPKPVKGKSPSGLCQAKKEMLKACAWNILPLKNWVSSEQEPVHGFSLRKWIETVAQALEAENQKLQEE